MNLEEELREAEVLKWVREMWSNARLTDADFHNAAWWKLRNYPADTVKEALRKHKRQEPDLTRPRWKLVFPLLPKRGGGGEKNPLELKLWQIRRHWAKGDRDSRYAAENWTDEEVWNDHVSENVMDITHEWLPIGDKMGWAEREDPGGERAKRQARQRANYARSMISELEEADHPVPDWLRS